MLEVAGFNSMVSFMAIGIEHGGLGGTFAFYLCIGVIGKKDG